MDEIKLLGLQRAEFQRAEILGSRSNNAQIAIVLITTITIFVETPIFSYFLAVINLIVALVWLYLSLQAKQSHRIAERARRAVVFSNGLGIKLGRKSFTDLKMLFKVSDSEGEKYEDSTYFKASSDYGNKKLAEIVEESSFWSKHLFKMSAVRYWFYFGITLTLSIIGILLLPLINIEKLNILVSQVFCLVLIWLITGNLFTTAMAFSNSTIVADSIESRLGSMAMNEEPDQDVLVIVSDYDALVENSPTIPTDLYEKKRDKLNKLWSERNN